MTRDTTPDARADAGPLAGVQVLDLTRVLAGPYCTMFLGDYGADVIKIERPGSGDDTRGWGPPFVEDQSVYFLTVNRNKRSVAVDLSTDVGRDLVRSLALRADVVVENFRPGTMERFGLGYEDLAEESPGLIYCSMSGYGNRGPRRSDPGYDAFVIARGGLMSITGEPDGVPVRPGVALLDAAMGIAASGAISAALFARGRDGTGQRIDLSLFATQVAMLVNVATNYLIAGEVAQAWGSAHPSIVPYQAFRASDGYVMVGAPNETFWRKLCEAIERPDLADDPRYATNADRVTRRDEVVSILGKCIATRTVDEWVERLEPADVPVAPINDIARALTDPQVEALGLIQEVEHPSAGPIHLVGPMVDYSATPASIQRPPPRLGEHTDEVLQEVLQLDAARLRELRDRKIID